MNDSCPICLETFEECDNTLCMPVCNHRIHTRCELKAAQYDARCPICRTKDPELTTRQDDDMNIYTTLEQVANEHDIEIRRYNRKRSRTIAKSLQLKLIRDKLNTERKKFVSKEKQLEREWARIQKHQWNHNPEIMHMKNDRKKIQRRQNALCKRLEAELTAILGPKPDDIMFNLSHIFNH